MKLIDLIAAIGGDPESEDKIQICHPGRNWDNYDTFNAGSKLLKPFYDLKVSCLSAIETDVIRVDLDFNEKRMIGMRLIDADKIIDSLGGSDMDFAIGAVIDEQPTVFDVDKVVEQLEQLKMRYFLTIANTGDADKDCAYKNIANTIDRAIEIIKGGGVE